jgi:transcription initiation factor TFIID subunit 5
LGKSGEFSQYAIRSLQTFFKNNEAVLGKGQNAQQAAVYSKLYAGIDPSDYDESFSKLQNFIDLSLDEVKTELSKVLFPVFVCLFLNMILKNLLEPAKQFFAKHKS